MRISILLSLPPSHPPPISSYIPERRHGPLLDQGGEKLTGAKGGKPIAVQVEGAEAGKEGGGEGGRERRIEILIA